jgi:hypothetical protein
MAHLTAEQEKEILTHFFTEARQVLHTYFEERSLIFSNSQLFSFVLVSPISMAIASDGTLDLSETTMLVDTAAYFDQLMPTAFDSLPQPENALSDKEFKKLVYGELRYITLNMQAYESQLLRVIKLLIEVDDKLSMDSSPVFSIRHRIKQMMMSVIYNNLNKDTVEEQKVLQILKDLGI